MKAAAWKNKQTKNKNKQKNKKLHVSDTANTCYCIVDLSNCGVKLIFADVVLNATDDNIKLMKFLNLTFFYKPIGCLYLS